MEKNGGTQMRIGFEVLLDKYGGSLSVAEALLENRLTAAEQMAARDIVDPIILSSARIRIEMKLSMRDRAQKVEAVLDVIKSEPKWWPIGEEDIKKTAEKIVAVLEGRSA